MAASTSEADGPRKLLPKSVATFNGQVRLVCKLLGSDRAASAAEQLRQRIDARTPIKLRGIEFSVEVMQEALRQWEEQNGERRTPAMPASWQEEPETPRSIPAQVSRDAAASSSSSKLKRPTPSRGPMELRSFMEASRRRTLGDLSAGRAARGKQTMPEADHVESSFLTRTAFAMSAARRATPESDSGPRRPVATPCRSEPEHLLTPPASTGRSHMQGCEPPPPPSNLPSPSSKRSAEVDLSSPPRKRMRPASPTAQEQSGTDVNQRERVNASAEPAPEPSPAPEASRGAASVKELKAWLSDYGVDFTGCVEKAELKELWDRFAALRSQPLQILQEACVAARGPRLADATACARWLLSQKAKPKPAETPTPRPQLQPQPQPPQQKPQPQQQPQSKAPVAPVCSVREREATEEVLRILPLRKEAFRSTADWGFAVLAVASRDEATVQRSYRSLMRKLHPDKVTQTDRVEKAIEQIREAKDACERSLSRIEPPRPPHGLRYEILEARPGLRRFHVRWLAPEKSATAPVCRYLVAALDPAYGKALTITVLEPDYSEELKRFVSVEELTSFVLAEENLQKMPSLWKQTRATVQIAAANEAGQSAWAKLEVYLGGGRPSLTSTASPSAASSWSDSGSESSPTSKARSHLGTDNWHFEQEMRTLSGTELKAWLDRQLKAPLVAWLKTLRMPTGGTKQEIVERILIVMGGHRR